MRFLLCAGVAALTACAGGGGGAPGSGDVPTMTSSAQAARSFMQAAADSNLTMMAGLWGTPDGPAASTGKPEGWEKRIAVMQAYLRGDSTRMVSDMPVTGDAGQRKAIVALYRMGCSKQIPIILARARSGGWLVVNVDLAAAGNPARPCEANP